MPSSRTLSVIVIAIGLAALLAGVVIDASGHAKRMAGSNLVNQMVVPVATLPPGGRLCEPWTVPADTAALRVRVFTSSPTLPALTAEVLSEIGRASCRERV